MRKILALALTGAIAFGVVSSAAADENVQTESFKVSPSKLSKKKYSNVKYTNLILTSDQAVGPGGSAQPPTATRTVVSYSKNFKFNYKKFPYCKVNDVQLASAPDSANAKKLCGKGTNVSSDGGSNATVKVGSPTGGTVIPVDVVAFNVKGGQLYLYSKPTGAFSSIGATVLTGKLKKSKTSGYAQDLDVSIPPLAAGAIASFKVTIPKSKYVQARCKPTKMKIAATSYFTNGSTNKSTDDYSQKCKVKKSKKKHHKHKRHHRHH